MTQVNVYATLTEFKPRQNITAADATDDGVIERLLEKASRHIDDRTARWFYPSIETRYYDTPDGDCLKLDADLCDVVSLTNGDGTALTTSDYLLVDRNVTPYREIEINSYSGQAWSLSSTTGERDAIALAGLFSYRTQYARRAWELSGAVLTAAMTDTTTLTFACTTGKLTAGQIVKIGSEIMIVSSVATSTTDTITVYARGDNGSTAATHLISTAVYIWRPQPDVVEATLDIALSAYKRLYGENTAEAVKVTAAGVAIMARDIPDRAKETISLYRRRV